MTVFGNGWPESWKPDGLSTAEIEDGEAYHSVLYHDRNGIYPRNWHAHCIEPLINPIIPLLEDGMTILDYGSGTGGSALELLRTAERKGVSIRIVMVDALPSWFSKSHNLFGNLENVRLYISTIADGNGGVRFRPLQQIIGGNKVDMVVSASTLHLIPPQARPTAFEQISEVLSIGGVFAWSSGDLSPDNGKQENLLHDPFRETGKLILEDPEYLDLLGRRSKIIQNADSIYPGPNAAHFVIREIAESGLFGNVEIVHQKISLSEAKRFATVPRLSQIAAAVKDFDERRRLITQKLELVFKKFRERGRAGNSSFSSLWHYGLHRKSPINY